MATATAIEIRPQAGPQERFLSSPADVVIGGGAAGGGKTWQLLFEPLRHINNPDFSAVIFRRTSPQLMNPGGLYEESRKLYPLLGAKDTQPNSGVTWTFPSGAVVRLTHLQHDKTVHDWQGSQIPLIAFDELTHFTAEQFWYLFSRNRSMCGVRPYIRAATNPEPGWLLDLIRWWIGDDGYAIPARAGQVRWFARFQEEILWADDPDELTRRYRGVIPKSLTFIPSRLQDNHILMEKDPGYLANLLSLPLVERERLLGGNGGEKGGNWLIMPSGGKVFNRAWFQEVDEVPNGGTACRFWDLAATVRALKGDDPDFTAGVLMRHVGDTYYITDVIAVQDGPAEVDKLIRKTAERDAAHMARVGAKYKVKWEKQPAAAGKRDNRNLVKLLDGFDCEGVPALGDKLTRAKPLAVQVEHGFVCVFKAPWTESFLTHMHHQPDWDHDDIMDASAGAYTALVGTTAQSSRVDWYGEDQPLEPVDLAPARAQDEIERMLRDYEHE